MSLQVERGNLGSQSGELDHCSGLTLSRLSLEIRPACKKIF